MMACYNLCIDSTHHSRNAIVIINSHMNIDNKKKIGMIKIVIVILHEWILSLWAFRYLLCCCTKQYKVPIFDSIDIYISYFNTSFSNQVAKCFLEFQKFLLWKRSKFLCTCSCDGIKNDYWYKTTSFLSFLNDVWSFVERSCCYIIGN